MAVFKTNIQTGYFGWQQIPFLHRMHWNFLLQRVVEIDQDSGIDKRKLTTSPNGSPPVDVHKEVDAPTPNFYNQESCLALTLCPDAKVDLERVLQSLATQNQRETTGSVPTDPKKGGNPLLPSNDTKLSAPFCLDIGTGSLVDLYPYLAKPHFNYHRHGFKQVEFSPDGKLSSSLINGYNLQSLSIGSLTWLYFYERMGIFKILGVLLDDYNYKGKYSLSSQVNRRALKNKRYIELMEHVSVLTRQGVASTFRDRISTYQRVLGVTLQNDLNVQSEQNTPFMKNFSKLISSMLEYYNAKRLSVAIQNNTTQVRSSVATQTSILNTLKVLNQNFEVMEYGRNMIHTFTGIATVYVTLCLIKQIRDVIGIPSEYDTPEEYVRSAYDILVLKKQGGASDTNRYTVFDSCASYSYRLLTDVQMANLGSFKLADQNASFDAWLSSVEEWVEGYNNSFKSIPDKTNSESAVITA